MRIEFKNGSVIEASKSKTNNIRGNRSNIIGCSCYDIQEDILVFKYLDLSKPIDRYIPEILFELEV